MAALTYKGGHDFRWHRTLNRLRTEVDNADEQSGDMPRKNRCPEPPATKYMLMSVEANEIGTRYSVLAGVFAWITLAGFITLPNTFTSLGSSNALQNYKGGKIVQDTVRNLPLLPVAGVLCFLGVLGTCWLWKKWRGNYIWLIGHLFM